MGDPVDSEDLLGSRGWVAALILVGLWAMCGLFVYAQNWCARRAAARRADPPPAGAARSPTRSRAAAGSRSRSPKSASAAAARTAVWVATSPQVGRRGARSNSSWKAQTAAAVADAGRADRLKETETEKRKQTETEIETETGAGVGYISEPDRIAVARENPASRGGWTMRRVATGLAVFVLFWLGLRRAPWLTRLLARRLAPARRLASGI